MASKRRKRVRKALKTAQPMDNVTWRAFAESLSDDAARVLGVPS